MTNLAPLFNRWGTPVEQERRRRIRLSVAAYAYECANAPVMTDAEYDALAQASRPDMMTGNNALDTFWRECFSASTGQWIHHHPELDRVATLYERFYK